jgi:type I restriction enzyme M protein
MNKQQLAAKIWASANQMRSKIDASEYKDYILGFIFYKFLSEKEEEFLSANNWNRADAIAYLNEDSQEVVEFVQRGIGYFIAYDNLYSAWLERGKDFDVSNVTDALSAFDRLVNPSHRHVFEKIFDTLETGLSKLGDTSGARTKAISGLLQLIKDIPMDAKQGYDVLGYIYEYLIGNFAENAGKKAGEFYTPHEVSLLISEIVAHHLENRQTIKIYDPTSGSGSLLINIGQAVSRHMGNKGSIKYYAQELKENTYNLTRMNLVMRGILPDNIVARNGDTLANDWPWFEEGKPETYKPLFVDAVVSNPPYSQHWDPPSGPDPRFDDYGVAPKSKADYAFLLHDLYHLQLDGIMCIVLPHGVLFRGGQEGNIRRNLIERDNIDTIIGLPPNIFFGTGIPTIVMVLRKHRSASDVLIIDASKGFIKDGTSNKLRVCDIKKIVDAYITRKNMSGFCRVVSKEEIRSNDYNLNIPRYVDSSEPTEKWDIYATMFGGIPISEIDLLDTYWDALPGLREQLFHPKSATTCELACSDLKVFISSNSIVKGFFDSYKERFKDFSAWLYEELVDECTLVNRNTEEDKIAQEVFHRLAGMPLVDPYEAYQVIDDMWETIANDLEMIQTEGFEVTRQVDPNMVTKKKGGKDVEVQDGWVGRIFPFDLIQHELLKEDLSSLEDMKSQLEAIDSELASLVDDMSDEDKQDAGEALSEAGDSFASGAKVKKKAKELADSPLGDTLTHATRLIGQVSGLKKKEKQAVQKLDDKTKKTIESLTDDASRQLLDAKWCHPIIGSLAALPKKEINSLVSKLNALSEKYATTLSDIDAQIKDSERSLCGMLGELEGSEADMAGLEKLCSLLGGGKNA